MLKFREKYFVSSIFYKMKFDNYKQIMIGCNIFVTYSILYAYYFILVGLQFKRNIPASRPSYAQKRLF